jgi:STE24 endopeptidase
MLIYLLLAVDLFILCLYLFASVIDVIFWKDHVPSYFAEKYSKEKYDEARLYQKNKVFFSIVENAFLILLLLLALKFKLFVTLDNFLANHIHGLFWQSYLFFQILIVALWLLHLPFDYYFTFVIEEKFKFNKSTKVLFFRDKIIELLLESVLLIVVGGFLIYFFNEWNKFFGWIAWAIVIFYNLIFSLLYSQLIVPLFNKQTPLEEGPLKNEITTIFSKNGFDVKDVYVIDSSKRSTKANAYFTGWGKKKRIVLYDTLLEQLSSKEIVAVLLHELGHYKKRHTFWFFIFSILYLGIFIFAFQWSYPFICEMLQIRLVFHMALLSFIVFFYPIQFILQLILLGISRKFEYQADDFARKQGFGNELVQGLINLTAQHLSYLHPHPLKVFLTYSHPPVVYRIEKLLNTHQK